MQLLDGLRVLVEFVHNDALIVRDGRKEIAIWRPLGANDILSVSFEGCDGLDADLVASFDELDDCVLPIHRTNKKNILYEEI
jgi:hypothetical protein